MLNHIDLMGRLTKDPELRKTQQGASVTSFTLAVERDFSSDAGQKQTDFINIVTWRNTAEFVANYFTKGQLVALSGTLQIREWTDKEGNKRRDPQVVADRVYFAERKTADAAPAEMVPVDDDGELPF